MRMVGVPESTIDYWIAKFLGQGHKVGRVDQAETALGADLRRQADKAGKGKSSAGSADKAKIVNRELKTVLTTGTIVDGHLLTDDLSNHCISVKEYIAEAGADPCFGIVIADCSTAEFTMSAFQVSSLYCTGTKYADDEGRSGRHLQNKARNDYQAASSERADLRTRQPISPHSPPSSILCRSFLHLEQPTSWHRVPVC